MQYAFLTTCKSVIPYFRVCIPPNAQSSPGIAGSDNHLCLGDALIISCLLPSIPKGSLEQGCNLANPIIRHQTNSPNILLNLRYLFSFVLSVTFEV